MIPFFCTVSFFGINAPRSRIIDSFPKTNHRPCGRFLEAIREKTLSGEAVKGECGHFEVLLRFSAALECCFDLFEYRRIEVCSPARGAYARRHIVEAVESPFEAQIVGNCFLHECAGTLGTLIGKRGLHRIRIFFSSMDRSICRDPSNGR